MSKAMFAAGCFWGVEADFKKIKGVTKTEAGYTGGHTESPTYKEVCTNTTGHAEVVVVDFDESVVSYADLLEVFWGCHNPTTLNRQGPDFGKQYRSGIFTYDKGQQAAAEKSKSDQNASSRFDKPIVTIIEPVSNYTTAEEYHQDYFAKNNIEHCPI